MVDLLTVDSAIPNELAESATLFEQLTVTQDVTALFPDQCTDAKMTLNRRKHVQYLAKGLSRLNSGFACLDSSRPWLVYWITHSLDLLDALQNGSKERAQLLRRCVDTIASFQDPNGGFCGGPQQMPHLAATYAATLCLVRSE